MYSRSQHRPPRPIQVPEHYSGCAFSDHPPHGDAPPANEAPPSSFEIRPPLSDREPPRDHHKEERPPAALQPFQSLFGHIGSAFPFSHGLGFDELLILGLILLLARNDGDSDIIPFLALLLFCG
ncbi:MAG: hypothetical protein IJX62_05520 [Clostridia bacterium]|nr:hypothetical protein [Clostridia bacterium]